jgi:hypothetical protein
MQLQPAVTRPGIRRTLVTALLGSVLFAGLPGPSSADDGTPAGAVESLAQALRTGRGSDLSALMCRARRDDGTRRMDLTSIMRDVPQASRPSFTRLLSVRIPPLELVTLEEEADRAVVHASGTVSVSMSENGLRRALAAIDWPDGTLDAAVRRAILTQRIRDRLATLPSPAVLDSEIELVREDGAWKVCSDIGWGLEPLDPKDICGLLSPAEIQILAPLAISQEAPQASGCIYRAAPDTGDLSSVTIRVADGDLPLVQSAYPDGATMVLGGLDAYATSGSLWIDLGGRLLTIQPKLIGAPAEVDADRLALAVAAVIVPRIDA